MQNVHRYVESLVSGKFFFVKKDFDPNAAPDDVVADKNADGITSTQEKNDYNMRQQ